MRLLLFEVVKLSSQEKHNHHYFSDEVYSFFYNLEDFIQDLKEFIIEMVDNFKEDLSDLREEIKGTLGSCFEFDKGGRYDYSEVYLK